MSWEAQSRRFQPGALRLPLWAAGSAGRRPKVSSSAAQHRAHSPCSGDRAMPWARRGWPAGLGRRWQRWAARAQQAPQRGLSGTAASRGRIPLGCAPRPRSAGGGGAARGRGVSRAFPGSSAAEPGPQSPRARPEEESRLRKAGARERRASSVSALPGRGDEEPAAGRGSGRRLHAGQPCRPPANQA